MPPTLDQFRVPMDHRYIDQHDVAERYLRHGLAPEEREAFESHLVDCQECADRLLLAEMFHARNGVTPARAPAAASPEAAEETDPLEALPFRARIVASVSPLHLTIIVIVTVLLLLAIPGVYFLWELNQLGFPR
jgi:anti-sigma factor RsiW